MDNLVEEVPKLIVVAAACGALLRLERCENGVEEESHDFAIVEEKASVQYAAKLDLVGCVMGKLETGDTIRSGYELTH